MGRLNRLLGARAAGMPPAPGPLGGRLAACPSAPRCVSTLAADPARRVAPIGYAVLRAEMRTILLEVIRSWPRTQVVTADEDYIHALQRSRAFGFPDDLECHLPAAERLVHMRSAARIGWYDFGVNRARVEHLRRVVNQRLAERQ